MLEGQTVSDGWAFQEAPAGEAVAGDAALEQAVREHSRFVYRVAFAILRNHQDAEDATQETFLRVLRLRRELEGVRDAKAWLARVAFRVAVDRRPRGVPVSLDDESVSPTAASLPSGGAGADEIAASRQIQILLGSAIAALPADLRHAVQLSTLEELNSPEIAVLLGIPEGTVRTRLMRARQVLRESLSPVLGVRHDR
jgi:RNA polymerase sigma-70 factor (ECF subfamily)